MGRGSSVNVHSFTAPRTPCAAPIRATQIGAATVARPYRLRRLSGGFGLRLALLARPRLFRIVARGAFDDAAGTQEGRDRVRRLAPPCHPALSVVPCTLHPPPLSLP